LPHWLGVARSKFDRWSQRLGTPNRHNGRIPRDFWLEDWEKEKIIDFHDLYPLEGYRRSAYMMLDVDIVAVSPSSVYLVLKAAGKLARQAGPPSLKGTGFDQPLRAHEHWHVDVSYINVAGTFFYLRGLLDGNSRFIVHWELRESMTEPEIETIIQRARERVPGERPRIISDNGPQFIAKDFKAPIMICVITNIKTPTFNPQAQREDREVAQDPQGRMHPRQDAVEPGGRTAIGRRVRGALQHGPLAQCHRLRHASR